MTEFTKENLIEWAKGREANAEFYPQFTVKDLALVEIALAALTAEPVAWRYRYTHLPQQEHRGSLFTTDWKLVGSLEECNPSDFCERQPLYRLPMIEGLK
ncbi:hypothetical protein [Pluralibacter sp.]|uniref:hypothetical protein n=1 Tax=Pluralibacter sp. TaxID=1920032 RepID=UPI0025E9F03E|nr:hypothetical protein [Pluralibacter sp.]MBV8045131.1 hypothetical protein [Pluralibacter sp.]